MNISKILDNGILDIADTAVKFYINNKPGRLFMLKSADRLRKSASLRNNYENQGVHIPPFLIASITSVCNLHCSGCYARANSQCRDEAEDNKLSAADWQRIFNEASDLGVSFILLAGGEPLMRRDILEAAAEVENIIFPVFTNGTMMDDSYLSLFESKRNLVPVISIEGSGAETDLRRGNGVSEKVNQAADSLHDKGLLFGASVTVTHENFAEVTEKAFVDNLRENGFGIIFYVEYVPAEASTEHHILTEADLSYLNTAVERIKADRSNKSLMIFSFPGDEVIMGGCLAAGRGFFHINPSGGAEPCPFSPFSTMNLKEQTILEVLKSPFFEKVRAVSVAEALNHKGGCTLFQHKNEVIKSLKQ